MSEAAYVVAVKPSARQTNAAAGRLVYQEGARHGFADREAAECWADDLSTGDRYVWIRRANPDDSDPVDAYLVGRRSTARPESPPDLDAAAGLAAFEPTGERRERNGNGDGDGQALLTEREWERQRG